MISVSNWPSKGLPSGVEGGDLYDVRSLGTGGGRGRSKGEPEGGDRSGREGSDARKLEHGSQVLL